MRIWDVNPGYLNRQSLLGEHRELHGIVSIIRNNHKGYSKHPETLRWLGYGWALKQRHKLLVAEMNLRGYIDKSPVLLRSKSYEWPTTYIDPPAKQLFILGKKYIGLEFGRIPIPKNSQQLWAQHKYSVMARDISSYEKIGKWVASQKGVSGLYELAGELVSLLQLPPNDRLIQNALLHMWGYVSKYTKTSNTSINNLTSSKLFHIIQTLALSNNVKYLVHSTSLSELNSWN
ncbi:MAG: DUF1722 domain-containing protein [Proteobacteria bacterium]|nr:DUF1722 domain-containing protein [Pseudomonadota bacterium]